jgi:hypothetical protein
VLPHDTYLTQFASAGDSSGASQTAASGGTTAVGPTITVTGCAPSHPGVATAIVRLRKLHNIQDVELKSSLKQGTDASAGAGAICKVQWNASLTFQPETAPTAPQPVPARLGGGQ